MDIFRLGYILLIIGFPSLILFAVLGCEDDGKNHKKTSLFFGLYMASILLVLCAIMTLVIGVSKSEPIAEKIYAEENYKETISSEDFVDIDYLFQNIRYVKEDTITKIHYDYVTYNFNPQNGIHIYVYDEKVGIK